MIVAFVAANDIEVDAMVDRCDRCDRCTLQKMQSTIVAVVNAITSELVPGKLSWTGFPRI
jgi:hypothetical protein